MLTPGEKGIIYLLRDQIRANPVVIEGLNWPFGPLHHVKLKDISLLLPLSEVRRELPELHWKAN